jgi:hypothetical protein
MFAGETRETVDMMAGLAVLVEQYLGKQSRAAVSRADIMMQSRAVLSISDIICILTCHI